MKLPPETLADIFRDLCDSMSNTTAPKSIFGSHFIVKFRCDLAETQGFAHGRQSYGIRASLSRMEKKTTALALSFSLSLTR